MEAIAAISTAYGNGGISIVRLSGENVLELVDKIFVSPEGKVLSSCASHTINYGFIEDKESSCYLKLSRNI